VEALERHTPMASALLLRLPRSATLRAWTRPQSS
jgi:hypothetical protein